MTTHLETLEKELHFTPGTLGPVLEKLGLKLEVARTWDREGGKLTCRICGGQLIKSRFEDPTLGHQDDCPNMPCRAVLHHGPGHQSKAHCDVLGPHDVHEARVMGQQARWRGMDSSTGFFDELEEID